LKFVFFIPKFVLWNVLDFYNDCPGKSIENVLEYPGKSWNLKQIF